MKRYFIGPSYRGHDKWLVVDTRCSPREVALCPSLDAAARVAKALNLTHLLETTEPWKV